MVRDFDARSGFFVLLLAVVTVLSLAIVLPFLTYVLLALLVAFLLSPLHRRLSSAVGDQVSAFVLVGGALALTGGTIAVLLISLPANVSNISGAITDVLQQSQIQQQVREAVGVRIPINTVLSDAPRRAADLLVGDISTIASMTIDTFLGLLLFVFLVYYLLKDGDRLVAWVSEIIPLRPSTAAELRQVTSSTTWAVLKGHVLVALVQGGIAGLGLLAVGLPNVVFWTVVMMFLGLIPVIGVAGVLGPAVIYLTLVGRLAAAGFLTVYGFTVVAAVDDYLRAYVVDRGSELHSAAILVGAFGGVYAFGTMGLFYGPIVVGLFQALVRLFDEHYVPSA